jgi:toxin ParE1/3/4
MARSSFSARAKADLLGIATYTKETWGAAQAAHYLDQLEACAQKLARNPALGRKCDWIRPGLYRFEAGRHLIFYRRQAKGILVVRILHRRMLPEERLRETGET